MPTSASTTTPPPAPATTLGKKPVMSHAQFAKLGKAI